METTTESTPMPDHGTIPTPSEEGLGAMAGSLPRGPWVASEQYGRLRFVLSQDNEIVLKCSHLPFGMVRAITAAANQWIEENGRAEEAESGAQTDE